MVLANATGNRGVSHTGTESISHTRSMITFDNNSNSPETPQPPLLSRIFFPRDHKIVGLQYLWLALFGVFLAMAMSLVMRIYLVWPAAHFPLISGFANTPERYAALTMFHASLMVFLVLTAAPQAGFGNYFLPLQIGAREMAFSTLNNFSFWMTAASTIGMTVAFLSPIDLGITIWIASVLLFCVASLTSAINFCVTAIDLRSQGMTLPRLPVTVWAWFINAILSMLIFSILIAACVMLLSDRILHSSFFSALNFLARESDSVQQVTLPALWQRLFWFFAQAEIYVAMLPCFGLITHLVATFARRPVWKERLVVLALCAVGLFGFCVWGQHIFSSGMNPYSPLVFSVLASSLGLPASILLKSWLATLWKARIQLNTAMLFALGFIALFVSGGLSGIFLARSDFSAAAASDDFVTAHFHLIMGVAATFAILGALFFWFPKMFGRYMDERLGQLHFWLTIAGVYCVFMPMLWLGLDARSRVSASASTRPFITIAALVTVGAQAIFLVNFLWSLFRGRMAVEENPWRATTLEWSIASPPPANDFGAADPVVYRGAYEFGVPGVAEDFVPQHLAPEHVAKVR